MFYYVCFMLCANSVHIPPYRQNLTEKPAMKVALGMG